MIRRQYRAGVKAIFLERAAVLVAGASIVGRSTGRGKYFYTQQHYIFLNEHKHPTALMTLSRVEYSTLQQTTRLLESAGHSLTTRLI